MDLCLGKSELATIYLLRPASHTAGLRFDVFTLRRKGRSEPSHSAIERTEFDHLINSRAPSLSSGDVVRIEIEFADGRRVSSNGRERRAERDHRSPEQSRQRPHDVVLVSLSTRSGCCDHYYDGLDQWYLSPLPDSGDLVFICEWAALGITETRTTLNGDTMREAAKRARRLWG